MTLLLALLTAAALAYDLWRPGMVLQDSISLLPNLLPFLAGSLLALLLSARPPRAAAAGRWLGIPSLVLLVVATLLLRHPHGAGHPALWKPLLLLAFSLAVSGIIVASLEADLVSRLLATRVMVFFGEISFSLYLLHMPVIGVLYRHRVLPPGWPAWVAAEVSILLAWVSYRLIERPGMRLGHRLAARIRSDTTLRA